RLRIQQRSGFSIDAKTPCKTSTRDTTQVVDVVTYYGVVQDSILLEYYTFKVIVFLNGFNLVNLHEGQSQFKRDPFVLALQVTQVFYSREDEASPRGFIDFRIDDENTDNIYRPQLEIFMDENNERDKDGGDCISMIVSNEIGFNYDGKLKI
ncbi:hypothetical protein DVH24_038875, partial [Malus domestica]